MKFNELRKINVNDHIEKKNGLSYLSWSWAADQLLQNDPAATWEYGEPKAFGKTLMVFCSVTAFGKTMTAQLPVLNYSNKAIPEPDAMSVNTAMQRCLAKAIALHGIGLYIYAGEDIPQDDKENATAEPETPKASTIKATDGALDKFTKREIELLAGVAEEITFFVKNDDLTEAHNSWDRHTNDEKTAIWTFIDSTTRSKFKKG